MDFLEYILNKAKNDNIEKVVVGAVIINEENKVLILSRKLDDFMGGIDELPSGNMENQENIYQSLKREIKEETNLDMNNISMYINSFDYISGSGKKSRQFNFLVNVKKYDEIKLTEHDEYKWQTLEEIMNNNKITDETKDCITICYYNKNIK